MITSEYVASLFKPRTPKGTGRKVWSIDLESVWLPFFTATNTARITAIPHESLGAPLRPAYNADGSIKFNERTGKPIIRVQKDIADNVKLVRENLVANLLQYVGQVRNENPEEYSTEVKLNREAGLPIIENDNRNLEKAAQQRIQEEIQHKEKVLA
jgi:hypothetical protein